MTDWRTGQMDTRIGFHTSLFDKVRLAMDMHNISIHAEAFVYVQDYNYGQTHNTTQHIKRPRVISF